MLVRPRGLAPDVPALLAGLRTRPFNYRQDGEHTPAEGWHVDAGCVPLPREPPGGPVSGGGWEAARRIVGEYEFVDPGLVRAYYDSDEPLERRTMVLELQLWFVRLYVGVRVTGVWDENGELDGRPVRSWGWSYGTLEGHVEAGERRYEVRKRLDTGEVEFETAAFSRPAARNPLVRLGFRLFGRPRQDRFVRTACERTAALVEAALEGRSGPTPPGPEGLAERPRPAAGGAP